MFLVGNVVQTVGGYQHNGPSGIANTAVSSMCTVYRGLYVRLHIFFSLTSVMPDYLFVSPENTSMDYRFIDEKIRSIYSLNLNC